MTLTGAVIAGVVLAGGRSSRMGGRDKAFLELGGQPLVARAAERLRPQVAALAISANADPALFAALGLPVLADAMPGYPGPLAGILAALDWAAGQGAGRVVTVAVDTPFFPSDLVARLGQRADRAPVVLAATVDGGGAVRPHATFGLWDVARRDDLRTALAHGTRKVSDWAMAQGAELVVFEAGEADPFFNVNTPDDLRAARALAGATG